MLEFHKYHGAGNDFILIDNRENVFSPDSEYIHFLCCRRKGIGADGLILLNSSVQKGIDFEMQYFNSDGPEGTMCGNGGRCIAAFARKTGIIDKETLFLGKDGIHKAMIVKEEGNKSEVRLQMKDVEIIVPFEKGVCLNTGSPHLVLFGENIMQTDVVGEGRKWRYDSRFEQGTNVNFVEKLSEDTIFVRTYERGVEDETLSCGTGVTASALAFADRTKHLNRQVFVETQGGKFTVEFQYKENGFSDVWLTGETCFVYQGIFTDDNCPEL
jgi:diaminopimelate epimerase